MRETTRNEALRKRAAALISKMGLRGAADALNVRFDALARFVAGAKSHRGTIKLIEDGLRR